MRIFRHLYIIDMDIGKLSFLAYFCITEKLVIESLYKKFEKWYALLFETL